MNTANTTTSETTNLPITGPTEDANLIEALEETRDDIVEAGGIDPLDDDQDDDEDEDDCEEDEDDDDFDDEDDDLDDDDDEDDCEDEDEK